MCLLILRRPGWVDGRLVYFTSRSNWEDSQFELHTAHIQAITKNSMPLQVRVPGVNPFVPWTMGHLLMGSCGHVPD